MYEFNCLLSFRKDDMSCHSNLLQTQEFNILIISQRCIYCVTVSSLL